MDYICLISKAFIYPSPKKKKKKTGVSLVSIVIRVKKKINTHESDACQNDGSSVALLYG